MKIKQIGKSKNATSWAWGLLWSVDIPSIAPLVRIDFPSARIYLLRVTFWLWLGPHVHFSLSVLGPPSA